MLFGKRGVTLFCKQWLKSLDKAKSFMIPRLRFHEAMNITLFTSSKHEKRTHKNPFPKNELPTYLNSSTLWIVWWATQIRWAESHPLAIWSLHGDYVCKLRSCKVFSHSVQNEVYLFASTNPWGIARIANWEQYQTFIFSI